MRAAVPVVGAIRSTSHHLRRKSRWLLWLWSKIKITGIFLNKMINVTKWKQTWWNCGRQDGLRAKRSRSIDNVQTSLDTLMFLLMMVKMLLIIWKAKVILTMLIKVMMILRKWPAVFCDIVSSATGRNIEDGQWHCCDIHLKTIVLITMIMILMRSWQWYWLFDKVVLFNNQQMYLQFLDGLSKSIVCVAEVRSLKIK